jgi:hypothetical protein
MKPWPLRAIDALSASALHADLRALLKELVVMANHRTATGFASQATIARRLGFSERHVRDLMREAEKGSAWRITRRRRAADDGRGRGSDEWTVWIPGVPAEDQPDPVAATHQPAHCAGETPAAGVRAGGDAA